MTFHGRAHATQAYSTRPVATKRSVSFLPLVFIWFLSDASCPLPLPCGSQAQLLELDPREICESAGRNYTSVCDQAGR